MYKVPILWVHDGPFWWVQKLRILRVHDACGNDQSYWVHNVCTNDKTNRYTMLVKRTNPIETLPIYEGPIKWVHDACTKDQSYWYMMHVQWSYPIACKKDKSYGYRMHVYKGLILWVRNVGRKDQSYRYTMHVQSTYPTGTRWANLMGTQCV